LGKAYTYLRMNSLFVLLIAVVTSQNVKVDFYSESE